jgi:threonine dehydrogenase-like Zn-dependent dehydrogenase
MRLIQFNAPGPPSVLQCLDVPIPELQPGEVLIRAHAIGVGIPDTLIRAGTYSHMPPLPATPGTELSGTIEKIGPVSHHAGPASASTPLRANGRIAAAIMLNISRRPPRLPFPCSKALISTPPRRSPIIR